MILSSVILYLILGLSTAFLSGVTGLAGGMLLFSLLTLSIPIQAVVAVHAIVQVIANIARMITFWRFIEWKAFYKYSLLVIPGAYLGSLVIPYLSKAVLMLLIGLLILGVTLGQERLKNIKGVQGTHIFYLLGPVSSFLGMIVGSVGPFIAPFFLLAGVERERLIATKSSCQFVVQLVKTFMFYQALHFDYLQYKSEIIWLAIGIIIGTFIAKQLLKEIKSDSLMSVMRWMLVLIAGKLIYQGSELLFF